MAPSHQSVEVVAAEPATAATQAAVAAAAAAVEAALQKLRDTTDRWKDLSMASKAANDKYEAAAKESKAAIEDKDTPLTTLAAAEARTRAARDEGFKAGAALMGCNREAQAAVDEMKAAVELTPAGEFKGALEEALATAEPRMDVAEARMDAWWDASIEAGAAVKTAKGETEATVEKWKAELEEAAAGELKVALAGGLLSAASVASCSQCLKNPTPGLPLRLCGRCKSVQHCDVTCQRADWARHKQTCKLERDARSGGGSSV
jgi:hypothetical protein